MLKKGLNRHLVIAVIVVFAFGLGIGLFGSSFGFKENSVTAKLVAVDDEGNGVTADLTATVRTGKGLVLVNINNLVADIDTQTSARKAAEVAANVAEVDLNKYDVVFDIKTNADKISGGSAGTPMTLAAIAAFSNKSLKEDVAKLEMSLAEYKEKYWEQVKLASELNFVIADLRSEIADLRRMLAQFASAGTELDNQ